MSIKIKNLPQGYISVISNGKHTIVGDEPQGMDLGFSPTDLLLSSLAMCKVSTIRFAARKRGWEIGNVNATLSQEIVKGENGFETKVKVEIEIEGDISQEQKNELLKKADNCYIHRVLNGEFDIEPCKSIQ